MYKSTQIALYSDTFSDRVWFHEIRLVSDKKGQDCSNLGILNSNVSPMKRIATVSYFLSIYLYIVSGRQSSSYEYVWSIFD